MIRRRTGWIVVLLLAGCRGSLSPLSNKLEVGQEPYIVFAADGEDGVGDLFASPPSGGSAYQVTFTRVDERAPALSPDGSMVVFLRGRAPGDTAAPHVVILNLLNGAERRVDPARRVDAMAWSADGASLYLRSDRGIQSLPTPPAESALQPIPEPQAVAADSAFKVLLGDPPIGEAVPCEGGGVCALLLAGTTTVLAVDGHDPSRWGSDSVAYVEGGELVVRPLGGGSPRVIRWTRAVQNPRGVTRFRGPH